MNLRSKAIKGFVLVAAIFSAVYLSGSVQATHSWGGYHWARTANPFTLKLGDNLTSTNWKSHLSQTSIDWNAGTILKTAVVAGQSSKRCSMVAGTTQVCNGTYGSNGWLGLASINLTGGTHITQGTAKMNDTYFNTATYNNPNERRHVMCQEVAHTFGLDHQSTDGSSQNSCMDYFSNTGANAGSTLSIKPNTHDFDELGIIYAHLDSTTTLGFMASSTAPYSLDEDAPENWGRLVRQSVNGLSSTYERDNYDGTKKATHVYWTFEAASACRGCDHRYDH